MIRLLHTADWHLGQTLMGWSRENEHEAALASLVEIAVARDVDALIVAGDVFDTQNPSERAEATLFRTLVELRHRLPAITVVVLAGNHDPAGRIEAPRPLLAELGVHVIGRVRRRDEALDLDRHLIRLAPRAGGPDVHVLALPHLGPASLPPFDRHGEEPGSPVVRAVRAFHDAAIASARARIGATPLVVTGHLTVGGGLESEGAERRILIGGEHAVPSDLFPSDLAYVALGHLHRPQAVGRPTVRYAGSLFPLSATERDYDHGVSLVEIDADGSRVEHVSIPRPVGFLRLPARGAMVLADVDAALTGLDLAPDLPLERRPFVQFSIRLEAPAPGLKADLDRIAAAHPVRNVGHLVERPDRAAEPPAPVPRDLADVAPEDLFARAFLETHGFEPDARHRARFDSLLDRLAETEA
ncbi:MAG: exonuclease subunit SbcD [Phyllobacteriaceae bacterium]|nr:exonuclease subunit SbcD [Phyllobacteriaceae bacterium]